jgi:preprotein translocase subunit SecF
MSKKKKVKNNEKKVHSEKDMKKGHVHNLKEFYIKNYKKLMIIPILLLLLSIFSIVMTFHDVGTPIYRDITLKGGLSAVFEMPNPPLSVEELKADLKKEFPNHSFQVSQLFKEGKFSGYIVDTDLDENDLLNFMENKLNMKFDPNKNYSSNYMSPTLSNSFFTQAMYILAISFILMSIVIFAYFREFTPSFAVVLSGIFDILVTVGVLDLFKVPVSISGIGALLMLIGYSIDTDVLLTNRLIREKGDDYYEKVFFAFKTGILMSLTTLIAGLGALLLTNSDVIFEISLILVIGLVVDIISTWLQNTGILLWWLEKRNTK